MISRKSLHFRFNRQIDSVSSNLLDYLTNVDLFDHLAVSCEVVENGEWRTVATARIIREIDNPEWAEWAAIVADPYLSAVWIRKIVECRSRTMRECACCTLW